MNKSLIIDSITYLDLDILENYQKYKEMLISQRIRKNKFTKWVAAAACLALVLCIIPVVKIIFDGSHGGAPISVEYASVYEVHKQLGYDTLLAKLGSDSANIKKVTVSYRSDGAENPILDQPLQLLVRQTCGNGETSVNVNFYVVFNTDNVDDSYIGGYEEQGLSKEINGVTVHWSEIFDGANHAQAKFIYNGSLYVVDAVSSEKIDLDYFLDRLLK